MKFLNKKSFNFILFLVLVSLIILKYFNTPYNIYSIINWNYESRMEQNYGYCKNESWGFYNFVNKKFNLKNKDIKIINDEGYVTLENLFDFNNDRNKNEKAKYLIVLNFKNENDQNIYDSNIKSIEEYKIKLRQNNCYLMELND